MTFPPLVFPRSGLHSDYRNLSYAYTYASDGKVCGCIWGNTVQKLGKARINCTYVNENNLRQRHSCELADGRVYCNGVKYVSRVCILYTIYIVTSWPNISWNLTEGNLKWIITCKTKICKQRTCVIICRLRLLCMYPIKYVIATLSVIRDISVSLVVPLCTIIHLGKTHT